MGVPSSSPPLVPSPSKLLSEASDARGDSKFRASAVLASAPRQRSAARLRESRSHGSSRFLERSTSRAYSESNAMSSPSSMPCSSASSVPPLAPRPNAPPLLSSASPPPSASSSSSRSDGGMEGSLSCRCSMSALVLPPTTSTVASTMSAVVVNTASPVCLARSMAASLPSPGLPPAAASSRSWRKRSASAKAMAPRRPAHHSMSLWVSGMARALRLRTALMARTMGKTLAARANRQASSATPKKAGANCIGWMSTAEPMYTKTAVSVILAAMR
mmetsp:Transcript_4909/g.15075  ORF Transcript_4909/g.15075 Transcript_4909/m.15075 type:complete len:274 (+) Transcript_4909:610-1431(+)